MANENIQELKFQVGEAWKGVYSSSIAYGLANVVQDATGLSIYRSLKSGNVGHPVSDRTWWFCIIDMSSIKSESDRIAALTQTIAQDEALRVAAEELRQQHETARVAAETQRNESEQARISAEEQRVNKESQREAAEQQRITAEQGRVSAESARVQAEQARVLAETLRANAEDARAAAEINRNAAEQQRIANEQARETQYAADHTRAEADHEIAVQDNAQMTELVERADADHTQAESDHTRAESDHTTATSDHTQAGSDHTTAAADHTQAGSDHTRAESDHTRAENDHAAVEVYVDSLGVFDLSKHNAVGGVLATYADLDAALNALNALDSKYKYGGMSIKFIQSSDNKYVQYRCIADEFTTDVTKWQGVTSEVKKESKDLVESGAVAGEFSSREGITSADFSIKDEENYEIARFEGGDIKTKNFDSTGVNQKLNGIEDGAQVNDVDEGDADCDFSVKDESEHEIFKVVGGYPKTKKFDGKNVLERINALEPIPIQKKIFCIGDSLTYAGGAIPGSGSSIWEKELDETFSEQYLKFVNYGVGGENSATILGRVSVIPYVIIEDVIIPATTTAVEIKIKSSWLNGEGNYRSVAPLLQGDSGLNPVLIDNIQGSISYTNSKYYFTRTTVGDARNIPQGTIILTNSGLSYPYGVIVWIGTNDGIAITTQDLIDNVKKTLLKFRTDKYLVIGVYYWNYLQQTDWTLAMREEQEKKLTAEFGDNFVNFRQYAISNAISDAVALGYLVPGVADGLVTGDEESFPTPTDITQMAAGYVPQSLRKDNIHLNNAGYKILAYYLTRKINRLNF